MPLNTIPNTGLTSRGYTTDRLVTPLIINGDMSVSQRATSTASVGASSTYPTIDRFGYRKGGSPSFRATMSQSSTVPTAQGFKYSFKVDCTTANTSLASSTRFGIDQKIEAQNLQFLEQGTSNAKATTLSFWVRSNLTGTYILWIYKEDGTARAIAKSYTINSADTWEKKIINIPGDTNAAGAIDNNNGEGWRITWHLAAGTTFNSGTLATSWENYSAANIAVGQVNFASSTDNEWYLTGVQLEVGEFDSTTIPSFPFESFENNQEKCFRYCQKYTDPHMAGVNQGKPGRTGINLYKQMRTSPSLTLSGTFGFYDGSNTQNYTSASTTFTNKDSIQIDWSGTSFSTVGKANIQYLASGSNYILLDAEI